MTDKYIVGDRVVLEANGVQRSGVILSIRNGIYILIMDDNEKKRRIGQTELDRTYVRHGD